MIPTQDQVRHVAKLARLYLTPEELETYQGQLASIFGYIEKLQEVDVSSVENTKHASRDIMTMRADELDVLYDPEDLLGATAQEVIGGHVAIPAIMRKK